MSVLVDSACFLALRCWSILSYLRRNRNRIDSGALCFLLFAVIHYNSLLKCPRLSMSAVINRLSGRWKYIQCWHSVLLSLYDLNPTGTSTRKSIKLTEV